MNATPPDLTITVNGQAHTVPLGSTLADVLTHLAPAAHTCATAVNAVFVPRTARAQHVLQNSDAITTFQAIVGG